MLCHVIFFGASCDKSPIRLETALPLFLLHNEYLCRTNVMHLMVLLEKRTIFLLATDGSFSAE